MRRIIPVTSFLPLLSLKQIGDVSYSLKSCFSPGLLLQCRYDAQLKCVIIDTERGKVR